MITAGIIAAGIISTYDPDSRVYGVNLDGLGDRQVRRINTGVDRPFHVGARVVCFKAGTLSWTIVGELDVPQVELGDNRPKSVDEAAADMIDELNQLRPMSKLGDKINYRQPYGEVNFPGDVVLENKAEDPRSRSRVKVYSFGAILVKASNFCFQLLDRKENRILTQARNLLTRAIGYFKSARTDPRSKKTTVIERVQGDVLEASANGRAHPTTDVETTQGFVPNTKARGTADTLHAAPKVERGQREVFGHHRVEEIDNLTQTARTKQDSVRFNASGEETSRVTEVYSAEGNVSGERSGSAKNGAKTFYRDWLAIQIDSDAHTVRVEDRSTGQVFELNPTGLVVRAKNMTISADRINIKTTQGLFVSGPSFLVSGVSIFAVKNMLGKTVLNTSGDGSFLDLSSYRGIWLDDYERYTTGGIVTAANMLERQATARAEASLASEYARLGELPVTDKSST